ncbi:MAG: hypothetical protein OXI37_03055, partial [Gammaproteobacteria bacterium]|nr:hypothetical protein [Gammaproteobacteria bacterium]
PFYISFSSSPLVYSSSPAFLFLHIRYAFCDDITQRKEYRNVSNKLAISKIMLLRCRAVKYEVSGGNIGGNWII